MNPKPISRDQSVLEFLSENSMQLQKQNPDPHFETSALKRVSMQMRAVLLILNADEYLMEAVAPFIDVERDSIRWDQILRLPLGSGHKGAIRWAYGVWTDEMPKGNCFDGALSMSPNLQVAVLESLCLRWGLREAV